VVRNENILFLLQKMKRTEYSGGNQFRAIIVITILIFGAAISGFVIEAIRLRRTNIMILEECADLQEEKEECLNRFSAGRRLVITQMSLWTFVFVLAILLIASAYMYYSKYL
jgi:hypothetical protein